MNIPKGQLCHEIYVRGFLLNIKILLQDHNLHIMILTILYREYYKLFNEYISYIRRYNS